MTDWGALYLEHLDGLTALSTSLTEADGARSVPATPAWTIHDVYAHLAGARADEVIGRTDAAPGQEWTARHVSERHGLALADLVDELRSTRDHVVAGLADVRTPGVLWDIAVHHADLNEALGKHQLAEQLWAPILPSIAPRVLDRLPLTVQTGDTSYGAGGPVVSVSAYELFRGLFSRRSRAQLRAWGPPDTPLGDALVDRIGVFGPRDDDQPLPV